MLSTREVRQRIKGVKSTGKITRAMEMISAVKMRRAVERTVLLRPYARHAHHLLTTVRAALGEEGHVLLSERPIATELVIVVAGNRGLAGTFYAQIWRRLRAMLQENTAHKRIFITIGKKGDALLRRANAQIMASFPDVITATDSVAVRPIVRMILDEFLTGRVDRVTIVTTDYVSALRQDVIARTLLPIALSDDQGVSKQERAQYCIEPDPRGVLDVVVPRLLEVELYHAILESNASQEAARMMAMRSATDAARDMVSGLTLAYNQIRQAKITQEIAELSAGKAALEN